MGDYEVKAYYYEGTEPGGATNISFSVVYQYKNGNKLTLAFPHLDPKLVPQTVEEILTYQTCLGKANRIEYTQKQEDATITSKISLANASSSIGLQFKDGKFSVRDGKNMGSNMSITKAANDKKRSVTYLINKVDGETVECSSVGSRVIEKTLFGLEPIMKNNSKGESQISPIFIDARYVVKTDKKSDVKQ